MSEQVRVVSVTDAPWADVERVFGTRGDPSTCWCQFFKLPGAAWDDAKASECKSALKEQVATLDPPPGVIAYLDDEAVGWCAVEPRDNYERLTRSQVVTRGSEEAADDPGVWAVTCFVVRVGFRRRGIGGALLQAAADQARAFGARVVEGYPVDTAERKTTAAELYHGTLSQFLAAGFELVSRPSPSRAVVRLEFPR
ncbi:MAG: GNAT family N-acetyltransferase [Leifsonia sp.]